ncbi:Ankyrin-1 [Nymphon striatum]|nr:Ankyrin-1 [Nymphon striatum]
MYYGFHRQYYLFEFYAYHCGRDGITALHLACFHVKEEMVKFLLTKKADPLIPGGDNEQFPLHMVCTKQTGAALAILLNILKVSGKDARMHKDKNGAIPLLLAAECGNHGICRELATQQTQEQTEYLHPVSGDAAIHVSTRKKDITTVKVFLEAKQNVNFKNKEGQAPLHIASQNGDVAMAKLFFHAKANPNIQDNEHRTPLHIAAQAGSTSIVDFLTDKFKASVFERTKGKKRPLKIAEENYSFLDAFAALATGEVDRAACEALEEYTSKLQVVTRLVLGARAAANEKSYIPAWSGFNCLVSTTKVPVAVIRYLPFINANPSDYSTIYTTLLKLVSIAKALGQGRILVTADLAIYSKAQQILWTRPDAIADMITMRLGGMMAFIASIDKLFGDGGLYNLLTESNVYATSTVTQMFLGKQYSRGMRGIRLVHEGMYQQFLRSAEQFANEHRLPWFSEDIIRFVNELEDSFRLKDRHACTAICQEAESKISSNVIETIEAFRKAGREQSTTFCYWDTFLEMGDILLRLTRADREANLSMHLDAVMKAIPFFFLAGRVNCARTVYVAEMKELDTKDPNMFNHMKSGGFVVKRAEDKMFNCVPTDQALEPTINREAKTQGGIIGFTSRKGALLRWLLTRHVTGEYSEAFKDICVNHGFSLFYDELGNARMQQDRKDATNIKEFIQSRCQNPFDLDNIPSTLVNITTGQVATPEVEKSLIGATEKCQKATDELFAERIDKRSSGSFWDPLPRCPVVTFSSKKKALSYDKDRKLIIDTEILFRRLLSVSKNCEVDMRSVLSFELAAVPPSLFHDDGSMRKTTKAELTKKLEESCTNVRCIHIEAQRDHVEVVRALLMKGENVDTKTNDGSTLIHIASENGHPETAMVFLRKGVPLHMPNKAGARCIHIAAQRGHVEVVRALLMKGENVDTKTNDNHTALHIAVKHCKPLVVELLLGYGAQVHIKAGETSETPLHIAARVQNGEKCAEMLLKSGTDVNSAQLNGETALHFSARYGHFENDEVVVRRWSSSNKANK